MSMSSGKSPLPVALTQRQILTILGGLMLGMLLAALDQTIVSTALPTIVGDLGGISHLSWVVTAYLLASTISTPLYGKLGDLFGRKRLFQVAICIFLVGSMLSGLSQNIAELIGFRALQGLGAGGLMVGAQTIIGDIVPPRERGKYQGMMGGIFALASIAGPLLGGFLTDNASWRWIFYINVPLGAVALVVTAIVLRAPARRVEHSIDWIGAALLAAGTAALILLTTWGGTQFDWLSAPILALGAVGVVLLIAFFIVERRVAEPIIPPRLFRESVFNVAGGVGFVVGFAMFGAVVFLPVFLQLVEGSSPTSSGLSMLPLMAGLLTASISSGRVISRTGRYKMFPVTGTLVATVAMALLSTLSPTTPRWMLSLFMVLLGAGLGMVMQVLVIAVQNAVKHGDLGVATSSATFLRSIGSSFGVAVFGSIFNSQLAANLRRLLPPSAQTGNLQPASLQGNPAALAGLPPEIHSGLVTAVADSMHVVFLAATPVIFVAFAITLLLKELPLRTQRRGASAVAEGLGLDEMPQAAEEVVLSS